MYLMKKGLAQDYPYERIKLRIRETDRTSGAFHENCTVSYFFTQPDAAYRMQYFLLLFGGNIKYGDVKLQTNVPDIEPTKQTIFNLFLLYNIKKK